MKKYEMNEFVERFVADNGIEMKAITAEQMREVDRVAVEETGPNLFQMMENAGRSLAELAFELIGADWRNTRITVLAGTGGNGGGGICAARHLKNRGADVNICINGAANPTDVTTFQRHIYRNAGGIELVFDELTQEVPGLIIDAVIGYGLQSAPYGLPQKMIRWANTQKVAKLSLDVPSGVDSSSGDTPGEFIKADYTMTLALPKTGLLPRLTGELFLADIGIPQETYSSLSIPYETPFDTRFWVPIEAK